MEGRRNWKRQRSFGPDCFGQSTSPFNGLTMSGNNHLERRIEVDGFDY
jgi:hypothetical protein